MIKIDNTQVYSWKMAIFGMRNAYSSWEKSDSYFDITGELIEVGKNDLDLMIRLSKAGNDHGKYLRMINIVCNITAPLYWWKQMDTFKIATVSNSTSTMHNIHSKIFEVNDFSHEHLSKRNIVLLNEIIQRLNDERLYYLDTKDKEDWWQMIQMLPNSYNQMRTWQANYQVLKHIYHSRKNHKLDEWKEFCNWIETLPYAKELICLKGDEQ